VCCCFFLRSVCWNIIISKGVGARSSFCPKIYVWKINKMHEFYMTFAQKNAGNLRDNFRKNILPESSCIPRLLHLWSWEIILLGFLVSKNKSSNLVPNEWYVAVELPCTDLRMSWLLLSFSTSYLHSPALLSLTLAINQEAFVTAQCTLVKSAVLRSHVVRLSVRL